MAHVSLRDIADRAGVSFQTVSKVLKGEGRVSAATRRQILDVATELGYVPNSLARSLVTSRTRSIGFIASGLASFVLTPLMLGAEREARARGYFAIFVLAEGNGAQAERPLRQLIERRVDGIVNAALTLQHDRHYGDLLRTLNSRVSIFPVRGGGISIVGEDPVETGLLATRHLLALGHRRVATIVGERDSRAPSGRLQGYQQGLREEGVSPDRRWVEVGDWSAAGGYRATVRLLDRVPNITALFTQNDHMAIGALSALHERGRRVPEDCAIVSCDDIDLARYTIPPLTTVRISFENTGAAAVRLLLDHVAAPDAPPERLVLPVELITRSSCGWQGATPNGG